MLFLFFFFFFQAEDGIRDHCVTGVQTCALPIYHMRKQESRYDVMRERVSETGMALIYANMVGGQDELVFDGASFALDRRGEVACRLPSFEETLGFVTVADGEPQRGETAKEESLE